MPEPTPAPRRLPRAARRDQILAAATRAFARTGYTDTAVDDITAEAGISKVILYRHFESKADLYRSVLDRTCTRLAESVGSRDHDAGSIPALVRAAAADPDGFRLLFRYAAREPEFAPYAQDLAGQSTQIALRQLVDEIPDPGWADWAARMAPVIAIEGTLAWLDAGEPEPETAARRIGHTVAALIDAARRA
ncbi:TetR family transcriptional regulator [Stackebrandtia albiflava]|uniref:TetR family transcriptional regulator n=1 Tax=Stackebrandtia albiflava TaxID=406432 RepID=A0A562V9X6_9ACTN|nr:TetR/AcrR family transcriptional regulator [Stackebrandtia albiflava]TWJ14689.1 TetR family transcriptional regulator [Stackebrandtia albiflava]